MHKCSRLILTKRAQLALSLEWINSDYPANGLQKFTEYKEKMFPQIQSWTIK